MDVERTRKSLVNTKPSERTRKRYEFGKGMLYYEGGDQNATFVPGKYRRGLIFEYHEGPLSGNVGREGTMVQLQRRYHWPYMPGDAQYYYKIVSCKPRAIS